MYKNQKQMIKKNLNLVILVTSCLLIMSCNNGNQFKISKSKVGKLTPKTTIQEISKIFENDSIVTKLSEGSQGVNYFQEEDNYLIYEKGGKQLLTIIPKEQLDSTSTIKSVEIHDDRYVTETGIRLTSNFSQINANNHINRIESTFSNATLFIDNLNATITIDKEELGLKKFSTQKVTLEQIPDLATLKSFVVWFN